MESNHFDSTTFDSELLQAKNVRNSSHPLWVTASILQQCEMPELKKTGVAIKRHIDILELFMTSTKAAGLRFNSQGKLVTDISGVNNMISDEEKVIVMRNMSIIPRSISSLLEFGTDLLMSIPERTPEEKFERVASWLEKRGTPKLPLHIDFKDFSAYMAWELEETVDCASKWTPEAAKNLKMAEDSMNVIYGIYQRFLH